jgi:hypothetical protein
MYESHSHARENSSMATEKRLKDMAMIGYLGGCRRVEEGNETREEKRKKEIRNVR